MPKNLRWKLFIIVGVVALAGYAFYPPDKKIRLGLDLKGGVHLVLRVQTEDAVRLETQITADRLREQLRSEIPGSTVTVVSSTEFRVENVPSDKDQTVRQ
jgi:preprotein translocase subunit SecD